MRGTVAVSGILYNKIALSRLESYVTEKVCKSAARIFADIKKRLRARCIEILGDKAFTGNYVKPMWMLLQQETPMETVEGKPIVATFGGIE